MEQDLLAMPSGETGPASVARHDAATQADTQYLERTDPWTLRQRRLKRAFDILVGIPLIIVTLPFIVVVALILAIQHRSNPIFTHKRVGEGGRLITIPKLRTLAPETPAYADKMTTDLEASSGLASFLRRAHLDELPQLWLVPLGQLSLVGPRPRMLSEVVEHRDTEYEARRTSIPQGCTGLWQVSVDQGGRVSDAPQHDLEYVRRQSLRLDVEVLMRTVVQAVTPGRPPARQISQLSGRVFETADSSD